MGAGQERHIRSALLPLDPPQTLQWRPPLDDSSGEPLRQVGVHDLGGRQGQPLRVSTTRPMVESGEPPGRRSSPRPAAAPGRLRPGPPPRCGDEPGVRSWSAPCPGAVGEPPNVAKLTVLELRLDPWDPRRAIGSQRGDRLVPWAFEQRPYASGQDGCRRTRRRGMPPPSIIPEARRQSWARPLAAGRGHPVDVVDALDVAHRVRAPRPRCVGSPISNVNRESAIRSRVVVTDADRMLTCWSDSARVTSDSSRARSSASTWICDEEHARRRRAPTRPRPSAPAAARSDATLAQSTRCTETPLPAGDEADGSSRPAPGVQHFASLTHTSSTPRTTTPGSPLRARAPLGLTGRRGRLGDVLGRALRAAQRLHQPLHDGLRRDAGPHRSPRTAR